MNIKRKIDTTNATYDLTDLSRRQFSELYHSYEKQWYIYANREMPKEGVDELLDKMRKMANSDEIII